MVKDIISKYLRVAEKTEFIRGFKKETMIPASGNKESNESNESDEKDFSSINPEKGKQEADNSLTQSKEVAIVGVACRFPGAGNYEEYWGNLRQGKSNIQEIPPDRWDWKAYWGDPITENNKTNSKWGGFIENVDAFDADFFGITAREAETMDPQQRLMLELSWSCFEDAGICPSHLAGENIGVFTGIANLDYKELQEKEFSSIATHYASGIAQSVIASRISYYFNFKGPSFPLDTACSSALTAIHAAVHSIQRGECSMALAGGVSLLLTPLRYICFAKVGILSPTGSCKTFDDAADGMVRGEGAGVILLKPLEKALADGDYIYGIVKGSAINHSGKTHTLTYPNPEAQAEVIIGACTQAGVTPDSISYIETHGTGTPKGDPLEFRGLLTAFQHVASQAGIKLGNYYCGLGSVKTNIGHLEAASGIASVIKVLLAMKYKQLPGIHNFKQLNHRISLQDSPFYIIKQLQEWNPPAGLPKRAGVSAFGFAGTNAHVIIEEAPVYTRAAAQEQPYYLICLSAKTEEALRRKEQDLALWLEKEGRNNGNNNLGDISGTLLLGREHFEARSAFVVRNIPELQEKLKQVLENGQAEGYFKASNPERQGDTLATEESDRTMMEESLFDGEINEQEYYNKLIGLAESYTKGYNPNWKLIFHGQNPRRISLPTYPFAKERHWVPDIDAKPTGRGDIASIHPLLHQNTSDLAEQRFASTFTGREFFLADHIVKGESILPGVAYLEMARAAVEQAAGALQAEKTRIKLKNVVWARPIVVRDKPVRVYIGLYPEEDRIAYEIYSQPDEAGTESIIHSQGIAVLNADQDVPTLDLAALQTECGQTALGSSQLYEAFKTIGLDYGPAHKGIEQLYIGKDQALARLTLPSSVANTQDQFVLHPSLMDAALQASVGLTLYAGETLLSGGNIPLKLSLPFALGELEIFDNCTAVMWAHIRPSAGSVAGERLQKLDIDLCNDQGHICVRLKAFTSRTLEGELDAGTYGTLLLEPCWREQPVARELPASTYAQHLVILCEPDNISPEDVGIRMNKVRCLSLKSAQPEIGERFQTYAAQVFEEIQSILKDKIKEQVLIQIVAAGLNEEQLCAGLAGLLKTARLENPRLMGQLICVEPGQDTETIIEQLKENSRSPQDQEVRYQDGKRLVAGWSEMEVSDETMEIPWKDRGVYLITGGAGGLGLIFAREIAHKVKEAVLILTGRSPLAEDKQVRLKELETLGGRIIYRQADVTDKDAITGLMEDIRQEFGNLDGIIHAAGMLKDSFIIKKTKEEFQAVLAPKVSGLVNLDQASQDQRLAFFVVFSSIAGAMGNPGQADYSTGNAFMDAYAHYRNNLVASGRRHGRTLSVNWPLWQEGGMQVDKETETMLQQNTGMVPMQTGTGIRAFYRGLAAGKTQMLVAEGNLAKLRRSTGLDSPAGGITKPKGKINAADAADDSLQAQTLDLVKQALGNVIGLSQEKIQPETHFEKYGIDSIMQVNIIRKLEKVTGELPKTLLFEYSNTQELVDYLIENHSEKLSESIAPAEQETIIQPPNAPAASNLQRRSRFMKLQEAVLPEQTAEDIAIIGISGRYPLSNTLEEFWEHLKAGDNCIAEVSSQRWNTSLAQALSKGQLPYQYEKYYGGFLDSIDRFDHYLFEIPRDQVLELPPEVR
ncbi:MAG TPA: SDR family NAD(P)-dependent oxidoreductase, partial [Methylomusa anaerophila]|uniref:type I polyketide synthase n=1 Tax=Methylomusa anaerophila TaxID=1930071 RepID=UPI002B5135FA